MPILNSVFASLNQYKTLLLCIRYTVLVTLQQLRLVHRIGTHFFGPTDFGGWSYRFTAVRPFVRPFVSYQFFSKTDHRIFPKLGMKLKDNKGNKVTEPNFPKKIWIIQKFLKMWLKMRFSDFCWKSKSLTPTFFD
jgi:hypothetical protein